MFSQLQAMNRNREGAKGEEYEERMRRAEKHMNFAVRIYRIQLEGGRYFVHEHPAMATSLKLPCIRGLLGESGVRAVVADQCEYGLTSRDKWGTAPAMKPTDQGSDKFMACSRSSEHKVPKCKSGGQAATQTC